MWKKITIGLSIVILVPFIAALFIRNDYSVTTAITINRPVSEVFDYVVHLKNQDNFSVWANMDPNMKKSYLGTDATVGFVSRWESEHPDVGVGEQEIKRIIPGERIDFELRFFSPFEATEPAYMTTKALDNTQTLVTWGFSGHMDYPSNLMFLFMDFEGMIGNDLQQGLTNLKVILEQHSDSSAI